MRWPAVDTYMFIFVEQLVCACVHVCMRARVRREIEQREQERKKEERERKKRNKEKKRQIVGGENGERISQIFADAWMCLCIMLYL